VIRPLLLTCLALVSVGLRPAAAHPSPTSIGPKTTKQYVRSVTIKVGDIFEDSSGFAYSTVNSLKVKTKEEVVRREVLLKEGDKFDPYLLKQTERNLRLQKFLRDIKVSATFDGDAVDIVIQARDAWTLIPYLNYSTGAGQKNRGIGLYDSNMGGSANRLESKIQEEYSRKTFGVGYSDPQLFGTLHKFVLGYEDRSDGEVFRAGTGLPFRSLMQRDAWSVDTDQANTVGRLFKSGTENYIFRQRLEDFSALYTFAGPSAHAAERDDPYTGIYKGQRILSQLYSVGFSYQSARFLQADAQDYEDLNLDPNEVSNDPADVPQNRRFSGPLFQYQNIEPEFITMNYVDRFDRVEDYNIGDQSLVNMLISPRSLGSLENVVVMSANRGAGWRLSPTSFLRAEAGGSARFLRDRAENSLVRGETKYYSVIGDWFAGDTYLGRHTFASQFFVDLGDNLDGDRQLLLGADSALRGYEVNTFEGDKRLALNLEERAHVADDILQLVSLGTAIFVDIGGTTRDSLGAILTDDLYGDVGFGLRLCFPRSSGGSVLRMDVAFPLRDGPDGSKQGEPRFLFSAGQLFGARLRSEVVGAENTSLGIGFDR
jgi:hypothetical protein